MTSKLHTKKYIKYGVEAAVGKSNEPAHIEYIIKVDACLTGMKWCN